MDTLNRSAIVVRPKQPFLDWLHSADPTSRHLTLPDLLRSPGSISSRSVTRMPMSATSCEKCDEIFIEQLAGWFTDETTWPTNLDFDTFCRWFDFQHHSDR